jgi:uncharacterized protein (TIGR01777 family)
MGNLTTMVIAGASGVVGKHLVTEARRRGFTLRLLTRGKARDEGAAVRAFPWDPARAAAGDPGAVDLVARALDGADVVTNLAGASLGEGRLGAKHKEAVLGSRVDATRALVRGRAKAEKKPPVWVQASAVGFYGDTGEARIDETAPRGRSFLADVCQAWEDEARTALQQPSPPRLLIGRIGLVLAADAPAWSQMLLPIKLGVGGALGSGRQWWAWIDADDLARALLDLAADPAADGVFNLTAPASVRQLDLTRQAATLLRRPSFLPAPAFALRLATGGVADELLLPSCDAVPARLEARGFRFEQPGIGGELLKLLPAR